MPIYDEMQEVARSLLGDPEFKQGSTVLIKLVPGSGPADNPGPSTETRVPLNGAVTGAKFRYVARALALATDMQIRHAVVPGVVPNMRDFVEIDGTRLKVHGVYPIPPAGTPVVYELILRK